MERSTFYLTIFASIKGNERLRVGGVRTLL